MTFDDPAVAQARAATDALRELERSGRHLLADPAQREEWSGELLDELARLTSALADAVEMASGTSGPDVPRLAAQLSDAILRRREATGGDRPTSPVLPAVGNDDGRGAREPKHRARRHLRPVR
ncbi:hypothetical protein LQ327_14335 [Actinomycetospora endophytica]|uniref:Uncharacterized protein n=1 Tax=Actinomycetospora endophytica TaxID=2291215 RepID=A0ABS8P954_9PSEU|nr:hypothetical protein [Actinomycetospora endophytica]MCD2194548.1 hypothetical protein [Actinomycetospora endophytica]